MRRLKIELRRPETADTVQTRDSMTTLNFDDEVNDDDDDDDDDDKKRRNVLCRQTTIASSI